MTDEQEEWFEVRYLIKCKPSEWNNGGPIRFLNDYQYAHWSVCDSQMRQISWGNFCEGTGETNDN